VIKRWKQHVFSPWLWVAGALSTVLVLPVEAQPKDGPPQALSPWEAVTETGRQAAAPASGPADSSVAPWILETEQAINQYRKRGVNIVVLDENGAVVPGAQVLVHQQQHAFRVGCMLPEQGLEILATDAPVWSVFNGVSLEQSTGWRHLVTEAGWWDPRARRQLDGLLTRARAQGIGVRIGPWVRGDPAQNPDDLLAMSPEQRLEKTLQDTLAMVRWFGDRVESIELYGNRDQRDGLVAEYGIGALRSLFESAHAGEGHATLSLRFRDRLHAQAAAGLYESLLELRHAFVRFDRISLEQTIDGIVPSAALRKDIGRLADYGVEIDWVNLEVGGPSAVWAAQNLEKVLRRSFAEPAVRSIWFGGLTPEQCIDPSSALLDAHGEPTPAGLVLTRLFKETWWDQIDATTSAQGLVETRLFFGVHRFEAQLPDGRTIDLTARIEPGQALDDPLDERPRWIVLQAPNTPPKPAASAAPLVKVDVDVNEPAP